MSVRTLKMLHEISFAYMVMSKRSYAVVVKSGLVLKHFPGLPIELR